MSPSRVQDALEAFTELRSLLDDVGESNWRRGIDAAIGELVNADGSPNASGWENARSIFKSMTTGGRGFAEYNIWKANEVDRRMANEKLDALRTKIWSILDV